MAVALEYPPAQVPAWETQQAPPLESGDRLTAREFLRRYEAMPRVKKAELIEGVVYMGSPVRIKQHAAPDNLVQTWLGTYAIATPGTQSATNATSLLDVENVPQPDALLRLLPECGGRSHVDDDGYLVGPPELAVEICASSASVDLHDKLRSYRRAGVLEYIVWRTVEGKLDWFVLEHEQYTPLPVSPDGIVRSRIFPGLHLAVNALLAQDAAKVMDTLQTGLRCQEHAAFVDDLKAKAAERKQLA